MSQSEAAAGSSGKKRKKAASKGLHATEVLWTTRFVLAVRRMKESTRDVFGSLGSPDAPTRKMSVVFVASLVCAAMIAGVAGSRYVAYRRSRIAALDTSKREEGMFTEFLKKEADLARRKNVMFPLGQFTLELRSPAGTSGPRGAMNLADIEIVLECDTKETRFFFEDNLPQARNQLTDVFVAIDRNELLSQDGKLRLKHRLIDKLNAMLPRGHVENLFFSKLILS